MDVEQPTTGAFEREKSIHLRRRVAYYACLIGFIIPATGLQVSMRYVLNVIPQYQWFVFQSGTVAYFPLSFLTMVVQYYWSPRSKRPALWVPGLVPKSAVMAFLDGLANFCVIVGSTHTTMALQTLVPQAVIPATMALSYWCFESKSNWKQIFGATCIMLASAVVALPSFGAGSSDGMLFIGILAFSIVPTAGSACYKQAVLQDDTGVFMLSTYITIFQIFWGFAFTPLNALPNLGGVSMSEVPAQITGGMRCLEGSSEAGCDQVLYPWTVFIMSVFFMNILMLGIMKFGSATASFIVYGMVLPLANVLTAWPWLMSGAGGATPLNSCTMGALLMCLIGLIFYAQEDAEERPSADEGGKSTGLVCAFQLHGLLRTRAMVEKQDVRMNYFSRVGISPMSSPGFQKRLLDSKDKDIMRRAYCSPRGVGYASPHVDEAAAAGAELQYELPVDADTPGSFCAQVSPDAQDMS